MIFGTRARTASVGAIVLVLAVAVVKLSSWQSPSAPATRFVEARCADLVVLGLRGSGQSSAGNAGVGEEVFRSVRDMVARLHTTSATTVRLEAVDYPAANPATFAAYQTSMEDGQRRLGSQYRTLSRECTDSKFAFVGFSQGAHAVHEFSYNLTAGRSRNLVLVAMIADPRNNPNDTIAEWSYAGKPATGQGRVGAGPRFGSATHRLAISFCVAADEVCNRPGVGGTTISNTHKTFYERAGTVRSTGEHLNAILHRNGVG